MVVVVVVVAVGVLVVVVYGVALMQCSEECGVMMSRRERPKMRWAKSETWRKRGAGWSGECGAHAARGGRGNVALTRRGVIGGMWCTRGAG